MGDDVGRHRARGRASDDARNSFSPLARPALFGLHLPRGLPRQFGRVQADGAGPPRGAALRPAHPRAAGGPEGGRQLPPEPGLFRLLRRAAHDERALRRAVRGAAARAGGAAHAAAHGHGGVGAGGAGGGGAAAHAGAAAGDGPAQPVSGGRCGAQLRGQRRGAARRRLRRGVGAARGGRRWGSAGGGAGRQPPPSRRAPRGRRRARRHAGGLPRSGVRGGRHPAGARRGGRALRDAVGGGAARRSRRRARGGEGGGLVPGAHGVRAAGAGRALHPRGRARPGHARDAQRGGEAARVVPALRAQRARRGRGGLVRDRPRQPLHVVHGGGAGRRHSGDDARGRLGAAADGARGHESALPRAARGVPRAHGLPGAREHELQRARRADRVHAGGRLPLFHGHGHRPPGHRRLLPAEGGVDAALRTDHAGTFEPD